MKLEELQHYLASDIMVLNTETGRYYPMVSSNNTNTIRNGIPILDVISDGNYKPAFYPLSALTEPVLEGGKIPIVELLKQKYSNRPTDGKYSEITISEEGYPHAYYTYSAGHEIVIVPHFANELPLWIVEQLFKWNFWLFDQKMFETGELIDKRTIK